MNDSEQLIYDALVCYAARHAPSLADQKLADDLAKELRDGELGLVVRIKWHD